MVYAFRISLLILSLTFSLYSAPALAWGAQGHRITGLVANALLTPQSRAALRQLLGTDNVADEASWLDQNRPLLASRLPGSTQWHYDNIPLCTTASHDSYCSGGRCATAALDRFMAVLQDPQASQDDKRLAVRVIIHVAGDLAQPLHASDNHDRGGNDVRVTFAGQQGTLHTLWDTTLVKRAVRGQSEAAFATGLLTDFGPQLADWAQGTPDQWAREANAVSRALVYGDLPGALTCPATTAGSHLDIPLSYADETAAILRRQLIMGGVHIAALLNRAFADFQGQPPASENADPGK
ncbi:S1/P1 nuclease [Silvimonas iriomotensis]|uniref:Endonuclease n=1 Tax=Silvimonas iriomotensis TaxID=449662 RepID=A0ABQ2PER7_9NEIS|nr:S1/P1 nuclease [Silvimonas iriomotensis]GGP23755.1 endonuclease [Silvimonas iriomotensis]